MVARIRGDVRVPDRTSSRASGPACSLNPDPFTRLVSQQQDVAGPAPREVPRPRVRTGRRRAEGDASGWTRCPSRSSTATSASVAAVASQADSWISDVKLYQTLVLIDGELLPDGKEADPDEELKPDMTAEVTITRGRGQGAGPDRARPGGHRRRRDGRQARGVRQDRRPATSAARSRSACTTRRWSRSARGWPRATRSSSTRRCCSATTTRPRPATRASKNGDQGRRSGEGDDPKGDGGGCPAAAARRRTAPAAGPAAGGPAAASGAEGRRRQGRRRPAGAAWPAGRRRTAGRRIGESDRGVSRDRARRPAASPRRSVSSIVTLTSSTPDHPCLPSSASSIWSRTTTWGRRRSTSSRG